MANEKSCGDMHNGGFTGYMPGCPACEEANKPKLTARVYGLKAGDYQLVNGWWRRHNAIDLPETLLPPLGVMVELDSEPVGALWCYESFGIGVAFLEWPCSKPGLGRKEATEVFRFAIEACISLAKSHGDYSVFRCSTLAPIARVLPKFGFMPEHGGHRYNFMLRRD